MTPSFYFKEVMDLVNVPRKKDDAIWCKVKVHIVKGKYVYENNGSGIDRLESFFKNNKLKSLRTEM